MTIGMIASWKADHLRYSLFGERPWDVSPEKIFADVFSVAPDTTSQQLAAGKSMASGNWSAGRIEVHRTINRLDCFLRPTPAPQFEMPLLSSLGTLLPEFTALLANWTMQQSQEVVRIALGCGGLLAAESVEDSYRKLREMIRVISVDAERFRDFQFQVNLRTKSKNDVDLLLNRITNWSAVQFQATLSGAGIPQTVQTMHFCACAIDVNTDGDRTTPLNKNTIRPVVEELCQEALGILDEGIE